MFAKQNLLTHFKAISEVLSKHGLTASLDPVTFHLTIRSERGTWALHPQFIARKMQKKLYTPKFEKQVRVFIGWRPYFNKRWPLSQSKLALKRCIESHGLLTPAYAVDASTPMRDVIVKGDFSTFAEGIEGPLHSSTEYALQEGQYFEQFIRGRIAKIWYWNDKPVYAELLQQPCVRGDGNRSIRQLIEIELERRQIKRGDLLGEVAKMLAYQGLNLDTVPGLDERVLADFRYGSVLTQQSETEELDLTNASSAAALPAGVFETMQRIGAILWQDIPAETRALTAYTVDAILDDTGALYVLEVNCNPFMHPGVYAVMLSDWIDQVPPKPLEPGMPAVESMSLEATALGATSMANAALSATTSAQAGSAVLGLDEILAIAEVELGNQNFEAALLKAKHVLGQSPYETRALLLAARVYARIRLYPQAKAYYVKFMELQPNAVGALFELGLVHFDMNEIPEAQTIWQQVLNFAPDFPPALFYSARISANNGAIDEARSLLETLMRSTPQEDPLFGHARNFMQSLPSRTH